MVIVTNGDTFQANTDAIVDENRNNAVPRAAYKTAVR
jgi:hypothetical protein